MNNFKVFLVVILLFLGLSFEAIAQMRGHCGMTNTDLELQNQIALKLQDKIRSGLVAHKSEGVIYVPVKFHLVADSDGRGRVWEHHVLEQLCLLNEAYMDYDIQFFMNDNELSYMDNDGVFDTPAGAGSQVRMNALRDRDALNMFFTDRADSGGSGPGTTLGYYSPQRDWIVLRIDQINAGYNSTIGHEVGHFFSLLHPHNGWDEVPYNQSMHGNPVQMTSSGGTVPTECHDRSNCDIAGDYLCDTPEDYNFGFGWGDCNYTRSITDPCGDLVDPQETLFMGYFLNCPDFTYVMSDDQVEQMMANLASSDRDYLENNFMPSHSDLGLAYRLSPPNAAVLTNNELVSFDWTDVEGANKYLLQVAEGNTFADNRILVSEFYTDSYAVIDELPENSNLYWRVIPFNEYSSCPNYAEMSSDLFRTGLGTSNVEFLGENKLTISHSVLSNINDLRVNVESKEPTDIQWIISNTQGQQIVQGDFRTQNGDFDYSLDGASVLSAGTYFVSFKDASIIRSFKLIVL